MKEKLLIIYLLAIMMPAISIRAQIVDSSTIILKKAQDLFQEKNYSEVIAEVDKGLALYDNKEKDVTYVDLLEYKALAYNWLHDNRSAMPIEKEAVLSYCKLKGKESLSCSLSKRFVIYYMNSGSEAYQDSVFVLCIHNIFKKNCVSNDTSYWDNLRYYDYYIKSLTGWFSCDVDLDAEYNFALKTNNPILLDYVNYAKGYWKIYRGSTTKEETTGINILERIKVSLEKSSNPAAKYLLQYVYFQIACAAEYLTEYSLAVDYYKKNIKLTQENWRNWRHEDPWNNLYKLLNAMENANMYPDVIEYCNLVLDDTNTTEKHKKTALEFQKKAYTIVGSENMDDNTSSVVENKKNNTKLSIEDSVILLYEKKHLSDDYIDSLTTSKYSYEIDFSKIFEYLLEREDYPMIIKIASGIYKSLNDNLDIFAERITKDVGMEEGIDFSKWGDYEERLDALRDTWHRHMGGDYAWSTCSYIAIAYYHLNDIFNAIKYQKEAVDIVRLNWEYMPNERERELNLMYIDDDSGMPEYYLVVEQDMYDDLAFFYLMAKEYQNAYNNYKIKLDAIREIIENQIVYGSTETKNQTWGKWNYYITNIIATIADHVGEYPPFADIILECNSIIKGFMLNIYKGTYDVAQTQGGKVLREFNRRTGKEKELEESYYTGSNELSSLYAEISRINIELNDTIGFSTIVHNAWQDFSTVEQKLGDNDVLVDFFSVNYSSNDIIPKTIGDTIDTIINGIAYQIWTERKYSNPTFYATILRKGWQHPKVVNLGQLASATFADGRDLVDHIYHQSDDRTDFNTIYRSTSFGSKIWDRVIEAGLIKEGENIYFCPTSYLNDIAIEYLQNASGSTMYDIYNMYRISIIRELDKPKVGFEKGDRCVAFGDIAYSNTAGTKKKHSSKTNKSINMASIPDAMTDRKILDGLEPTQGILDIISKKISKAVIVRGVDATEESFLNLSGNSPDILVIATHGYNYEQVALDEDKEKYLYGNRDNTLLSTQERSMYKSGLFMAQSPNNIPTNGMLTAKEISMCDLHNTKLAIIAACVSAVGKNTDEGVFGIQRGLKMAGVQSMLVSLWEVDADATKLLMEEFIKQYVKGNSAHESLRMAQQYVRSYESKDKTLMGDKHIYESPYFWAGFILID